MTEVSNSVRTNPSLSGLMCLKCKNVYPPDHQAVDMGTGCPRCLELGYPVSLKCVYSGVKKSLSDGSRRRMLRHSALLPYVEFPTLGEGDTPLLDLPDLASKLGVSNLLYKNEGQNPTGSHKDRMSGLAVARAAALGKNTIVAASSGNAGASLAAYAAAAGIECVIVTMSSISPMWEAAIEYHGAQLHARQGQDDRWKYMQQMVKERGWYPVTNFLKPPVSSNPFGIEGYKTIAYELVEELPDLTPLVVLVPTCRGDVLAGMWYGFLDAKECGLLSQMPRLVAVEPGPRLERVMQGRDYRDVYSISAHHLSSIGGDTATYQSYDALAQSNGGAVSVTTEQSIAAQKTLGRQGLYVELSSAAALAGAEELAKSGYFKPQDNVVLIGTSHGYKELPPKHSWT